jgi:hypothetical protein
MDGAENFKFKNIRIFPGEDENHVSGEYEVDAVIKNTGRRYRRLYGGPLSGQARRKHRDKTRSKLTLPGK